MSAPLSKPTARMAVLLALAVVVYASLYPFEGWREETPVLAQWVLSPWPRYWTASDLWVNWLGYVPLGAVLALWLCRRRAQWWRVVLATLLASLVSLGMESAQSWMVHRVASNLDWAFNTLGAASGAVAMRIFLRSAVLRSWGAWRQRHLSRGAGLMLLVLLLWLLLQAGPVLLPFAVGRLPPVLWDAWWAAWARWMPAFEPLVWADVSWWWQVFSLAGLLVMPAGLLRFTWRDPWARLAVAWSFLALAMLVPTLVHAWAYGWSHAGDWLLPAVAWSVLVAALVVPLLMCLPARWVMWLLCMTLGLQWLGVNALAETSYWALHWQAFTQGQFVRWYGLLTWVAVLWPLLAVALMLRSRWMSHSAAMA